MNAVDNVAGSIRLLTFDCYGTLIDWESGIRGALGELLAAAGVTWNERYFDHYLSREAYHEAAAYKSYRQILTAVEQELLTQAGVRESSAQLAHSLAHWRPFSDSVAALGRLKRHFQLGVLSNIDRDLFALSARHLGVTFDLLITAEDVEGYKPAHGHFLRLLEQIPFDRAQHLHVAQSLYHDVQPCNALNIPCVWINRRQETNNTPAKPDAEFPDLASFADAMLAGPDEIPRSSSP